MAQKEQQPAAAAVRKSGPVSSALDKVFHFTERGSTMKSEIGAGLGSFCIAVCALLMNTQIIGSAYGNSAGSYLAVGLLCFAGTLLLGIICNLPLQQTANMGLSSVLISMLGTDTGLTYANLMAVTFVAAVVYLALVLSPARRVLVVALPDGVKKALPVGIGLYIMYTGLKNAGILNAEGAMTRASDLTTLNIYYFWLMIAAVFLFILFKALRRKKPAFATFGILIGAMWIGGIIFFMDYFIGGQTASVVVYERLNLVVATDGADPYNIVTGLQSLQTGALFTEGFDFSAYTAAGGSVPLLFVQGIFTFVLMGLYSNLGNARATAVAGGYEEESYAAQGERRALVLGAALNVAAPVLGASPTSVGSQSAVGAGDGGKTGLSSVAASVGWLIALFTWVFFMLFATSTNGVGMWVGETETKLAAYVQDGFAFADLIMVLVGATMLRGVRACDPSRRSEWIPFAATLGTIAFLGDIALGVGVGCVACVLCKAVSQERRELNVSSLVLSTIMLAYVILALL